MPQVMAVSFEQHGRLYYVDPGPHRPRVGDHVLVPTDAGHEVAQCVWAPEYVADEGFTGLPVCAGPATKADLTRDAENRRIRARARVVANRLIRTHELPMKVVGIDYLDRSDEYDHMVVIYFTAPHRVDFRRLLGDLARTLQSRIDLRQIGSRDSARLIGGISHCGREYCCSSFLTDFDGISMRLARAQDLPPNPLRISGACGRLMCCLKFEHPLYVDFLREAPPVGSQVETPDGTGTVVGHSVPADSVVVRMDATGEVAPCPRASVCEARALYESRD
ncbi:PSP1 domain-containing protein [Enemella sp. A6]|uniref:PSP1 domain-containing protein n=1 Tax=Enemella sp. A6 TaxID=3440152 RepID=UPI003EBF5979